MYGVIRLRRVHSSVRQSQLCRIDGELYSTFRGRTTRDQSWLTFATVKGSIVQARLESPADHIGSAIDETTGAYLLNLPIKT